VGRSNLRTTRFSPVSEYLYSGDTHTQPHTQSHSLSAFFLSTLLIHVHSHLARSHSLITASLDADLTHRSTKKTADAHTHTPHLTAAVHPLGHSSRSVGLSSENSRSSSSSSVQCYHVVCRRWDPPQPRGGTDPDEPRGEQDGRRVRTHAEVCSGMCRCAWFVGPLTLSRWVVEGSGGVCGA
jgi:hypothetical protein